MNRLICPEPNTVESIAFSWAMKKVRILKLKHQIAECVKNNQFDEAKRLAYELEAAEKMPVVWPNLMICY